MIPSRLTLLVSALFILSACSTTDERTVAAAGSSDDFAVADDDSTAVAAAAEDPLVCKNVVPAGTRVAQRTCMRQSEIDKAKRDGSGMLEEVQRRGVQAGNTSPE